MQNSSTEAVNDSKKTWGSTVAEKPVVEKVSFDADINSIKEAYTKLGSLHHKRQGVKDRKIKADITNKHTFDLNAIKNKIAIVKAKINESEDIDALKKLLTWERQRHIISVADEYALNKMEFDALEYTCILHRDAPSDYQATLGSEYKHIHYWDETRDKEMYVTWIEYEIPPESQIQPELAWKMSQGFMPEQADYPKAKKQIRRRMLVESQWKLYFRDI